jgi:hypothetical protein
MEALAQGREREAWYIGGTVLRSWRKNNDIDYLWDK